MLRVIEIDDCPLPILGVTAGFEATPIVAGPMGRSVSDIELACRTLFAHLMGACSFTSGTLPRRLSA